MHTKFLTYKELRVIFTMYKISVDVPGKNRKNTDIVMAIPVI